MSASTIDATMVASPGDWGTCTRLDGFQLGRHGSLIIQQIQGGAVLSEEDSVGSLLHLLDVHMLL